MTFCRDGTETHCAGTKPLDDFAGSFDFIELDYGFCVVKVEQTAERRSACAFAVRMVGELPVCVLVVRSRCHLKVGNRVRIPHVCITATTPVKISGIR